MQGGAFGGIEAHAIKVGPKHVMPPCCTGGGSRIGPSAVKGPPVRMCQNDQRGGHALNVRPMQASQLPIASLSSSAAS